MFAFEIQKYSGETLARCETLDGAMQEVASYIGTPEKERDAPWRVVSTQNNGPDVLMCVVCVPMPN